ncbi:SMI1/KNR4 family protein [Flammeovirga pacifica]|uniref:Knr4/Smi1-like domain-containing protein n=1 Tax=Flammeovirga pacifica TaxID=915059 RepID=A0A1S1YRM4_FLAPC|nr:SMI1/KNR4 family protein [Flammeovirga pacifica]OHX63787.1 hypothetical protein NH26_24895 [Flammeovirga pacifica]
MEKVYLQEAKDFIKQYPEIEERFSGCSEEEINDLQEILNTKIPASFKEFLMWFGKGGGRILRGTDYYYSYLSGEAYEDYKEEGIIPHDHNLKKAGIEILNRNKFDGIALLEDSIVFMCHQGYVIEYIKTNEGENPPVYIFVEQGDWLKNGPTIWAESFSEYMINMLTHEIDSLKKIGQL